MAKIPICLTCNYGIDEGSPQRPTEKKETRQDTIEVKKRKWLELPETRILQVFIYERREEVISYLEKRPFNISI